eukprot:4874199-Alexandrium_andersonii.AAC.1
MDKGVAWGRLEKAQVHLEFVAKLYEPQLERGARILQGRPATAASWYLLEMRTLLGRPRVETA